MKSYVLAFSGSIASGKSTLSLSIAEALQWKYVSFGNYVRSVARSRGLAESREILQNVGQALIEQGWEDFCWSVLNQARWTSGEPLVIDGIRHREAVTTLKALILPSELLLIFIDISEALRKMRLSQRNAAVFRDRQGIENHPTEVQVKNQLRQVADLIVSGDKPVTEITQEILARFRQQGEGQYTELCGKSESGILELAFSLQSKNQEDTNGSHRERYRNRNRKSRGV